MIKSLQILLMALISPLTALAISDYGTQALFVGQKLDGTMYAVCSANLIENEEWVLTAGHCVSDFSPENPILFRSANLQTIYRSKAVLWTYRPLPKMGYFQKVKSLYSMESLYREAFNNMDFALVKVERIAGPAATGIIPTALTVHEMNDMKSRIADIDLTSTKLRSIEDLAHAERFEERRLILSEATSSLIDSGDSGAAIMTEDRKRIVAVTTELAMITSSLAAAYVGSFTNQAGAIPLPYGLCSFAAQIYGRTDLGVDEETLKSLAWLKAYQADCAGLGPLENETAVQFIKAK